MTYPAGDRPRQLSTFERFSEDASLPLREDVRAWVVSFPIEAPAHYRVAAAYAVVAGVLLQLVNNVAPALRIPDWGISLVLDLLLVGFPVALLFAWIHQLAPRTARSRV